MKDSKLNYCLLIGGFLLVMSMAFFGGRIYGASESSFHGGKYMLDESISGHGYPGLREVIEFHPGGLYETPTFKGHWKRVGSLIVVDDLRQGNRIVSQNAVATIGGVSGYLHYDIEVEGTLLFLSAINGKEHLPIYRKIE